MSGIYVGGNRHITVPSMGGPLRFRNPTAAAPAPLEADYVTTLQDTSNATTYTFSTADIGAADSARKVYVVVSAGSGNVTLSTVTVAGISASIIVQATGSSARLCAIAAADVPTGTTGDIVVTFSGGESRCQIGIFRVVNQSAVDDFDSDVTMSSQVASITLSAISGGAIIAGWTVNRPTADLDTTWTNVTKKYNANIEAAICVSGAIETGLAGSTVVSAEATGSTSTECALVGVAIS